MKTSRALVTGITGQDGSYLAELLLGQGYEVHGLQRRSSTNTQGRIKHLLDDQNFKIIEGDVTDSGLIHSLIAHNKYDEVYNLAAQSHVGTSFKEPYSTFQIDAMGPLNFLEAIRHHSPKTRFYQASTSEMYGSNVDPVTGFQSITTELYPNSPYAVAKTAAHHLVRVYRDSYGLYACAGVLFNHESERRGENFVTRKITKWIADFIRWGNKHSDPKLNFADWLVDDTRAEEFYFGGRTSRDQNLQFPKLRLGNVEAHRDWGHAQDYVYAMYLMLRQEDNPGDFVIATGETHSVRDFLSTAFKLVGIDNYEDYFVVDPEFYRPCEVEYLKGDTSDARYRLRWEPVITFTDLVYMMLKADLGEELTDKYLLNPVEVHNEAKF